MNINSVNNYYSKLGVYKNGTVNKSSEQIQSSKESNNSIVDVVDFSSKSTAKTDYEEAVIDYKVNYNRGVDAERINELKEQYKGDSCPVSSREIANSIISRVVGYCI